MGWIGKAEADVVYLSFWCIFYSGTLFSNVIYTLQSLGLLRKSVIKRIHDAHQYDVPLLSLYEIHFLSKYSI